MMGVARAFPNIALTKYWGKRDEDLNLPFTSSVSVTLDSLPTIIRVEFHRHLTRDQLRVNGQRVSVSAEARVVQFLDHVRTLAGTGLRAQVASTAEAPMGAGLASSSAAFAALALAAVRALDLSLEPSALSRLARRGSGSACRSLFAGFVEWSAGERADGQDSVAYALHPPEHWPMALLVLVLTAEPKRMSSRDAMRHTVATSPFYPAFREMAASDMLEVRAALAARAWARLGPVVEAHALAMHAAALAARPAISFWHPDTVRVLEEVQGLRTAGFTAYCTLDAGPNPVVLCPPEEAREVARHLRERIHPAALVPGRPGPGAE